MIERGRERERGRGGERGRYGKRERERWGEEIWKHSSSGHKSPPLGIDPRVKGVLTLVSNSVDTYSSSQRKFRCSSLKKGRVNCGSTTLKI